MSRILSFSLDEDLADGLEGLVKACGYKNRSRFLRDAVAHYSDVVMRGDIQTMEDDVPVEGTIVLYYQHDAEEHLPEFRHLDDVTMSGSTHACMPGVTLAWTRRVFPGMRGPFGSWLTGYAQRKGWIV